MFNCVLARYAVSSKGTMLLSRAGPAAFPRNIKFRDIAMVTKLGQYITHYISTLYYM